jgi:hypothetical protein
MTRIAFTALLAGLLAATAAQADLAPAKGLKRLPLEHMITTEKDYPEYTFFSVGFLGKDATPLKLDAKTPAKITNVYRLATFVAVPKDAAKSYPTEKDFHAAVAGGKVEGTIKAKTGFGAFIEVKDSDPRKTAVMKYKIEKIDAKDGIVLVEVKNEAKPEEEESLTQPASRSVALGLGLAGLLGFTGLVVVRRRKLA